MPRYVLVEFEDNAEARRFVEKANGKFAATDAADARRRVIGVWGKPTQFCECPTTGKRGMFAFSRSARSGWWLHVDCGKPTEAWARGDHWSAAIGRNLLPGSDADELARWGVVDDPTRPAQITVLPHEPTEEGQRLRRKRAMVTRTMNPRRLAEDIDVTPEWTI